MKKLLFALLSALFVSLLLLNASAKETVIYENDFSSADLSAFRMYGKMVVKNGMLRAGKGDGPSTYVAYTFPEEYRGKDYIFEVDYLGCNNMGGLLIGATSDDLTREPAYFSGYTLTTNMEGTKVSFAYFSETGWGGTLCPGSNMIPQRDFHLWARVQRGVLTLRATSLDGKTLYQEFRYELGDHENDIYDTFTSTVGIRQYYADPGNFDNMKITILEDDELPQMRDTISFGGERFTASGVSFDGETVSGSGALLSKNAQNGNYRIRVSAAAKGRTRLYFGMTDAKNGYAFELSEYENAVFLYKIADGCYTQLGEKENIIRSGFCDITLDVHDGIASLYYDNLFEGDAAFPKFEFYLDGTDGRFGFWLEGGSLAGLTVGDSTAITPEETYLNPVNPGADPDMLYYEGTYYLYVYAGNDGTNIFRVYTSPDLVHFTPRNIMFKWDHKQYTNVNGKTAWSPNVFYNASDGLFYLFFAATPSGDEDIGRRVYYATSDSPLGPFTHDGPLVAINPDVTEIDGHPFIGYDGKTYMSFSRYDYGGTIWFEEVIMKDGVVTALPETQTRVIIPDREWDNDGAMRLCEGGFVWKHDGYYYLIYATVSYARHYGEAVAVSKNPLGPYVKYDYNPFLMHNFTVDGPGDALIIPSPDGSELYLVYHRHNQVGKVHLRQTCVDLIEFVEDPDGGPDLLTVRGPSSTPQHMPSHRYRYDVNRDGTTSLLDALTVLKHVQSKNGYTGAYDADANGSVGAHDAACILEQTVK
ncbi:MAG: family 43 glycosylhydrolase [Clostridia bacterium]|nr:family 43 glycosylhydrolase [Clostridia bacterium]